MKADNELQKLSLNSSWKIEQLGRSHGAITPQDVAAALGLGNLSRQAEIIGRAKYLDDLPERDREDLINLVMMDVSKRAMKENWEMHKPGILYKLICFAIFEVVMPPGCEYCAGRGHHKHEETIKDCDACNGTGIGCYDSEMILTNCEIDSGNFHNIWKRRYDDIYASVRRYDEEVRRHVLRRIG